MTEQTPTVETLTNDAIRWHDAAVRAASTDDDARQWHAQDQLHASLHRLTQLVDTGAVLLLASDLNASTHLHSRPVRVSTDPHEWRTAAGELVSA